MRVDTFEDEKMWLDALEEEWERAGGEAIHARGEFKVSLSGGETPEIFYRRLAQINWAWTATHLFVGDERCVPTDSPRSNYRMIHRALYPHKLRLERWKTESLPEAAAVEFEKRLRAELSSPPRFDLILLGIGEDGHTASLFPNTPALEEQKKLAVSNRVPKIGEVRLTITYPLLKHAREIWFLLRGEKKREWMKKLTSEDQSSFPAAAVKMYNENTRLFYCEK